MLIKFADCLKLDNIVKTASFYSYLILLLGLLKNMENYLSWISKLLEVN